MISIYEEHFEERGREGVNYSDFDKSNTEIETKMTTLMNSSVGRRAWKENFKPIFVLFFENFCNPIFFSDLFLTLEILKNSRKKNLKF